MEKVIDRLRFWEDDVRDQIEEANNRLKEHRKGAVEAERDLINRKNNLDQIKASIKKLENI